MNPDPGVPFRWPVRVYWEDTDAGGVVYHARYLHFLERARTEWLRAAGIDQGRLRETHRVQFVVHRMQLEFRAPARLDDALSASVVPVQRRGASFQVAQALTREPDGILLVQAQVRIACVNSHSFRPHPIPDGIFPETAHP